MPGADDEDWFDTAAGADAAVAARLEIDPASLAAHKKPITIDPVVVRREGARWRSRQVWSLRQAASTVRIFEMLRIDEAVYDH